MEKYNISLKEAKHKKVHEIRHDVCDCWLVIHFTDGSWCGVELEHYGPEPYLEELHGPSPYIGTRYQQGCVSKEEYEQYIDEQIEKTKEREDKADKAELKRLLEKFNVNSEEDLEKWMS